MSDRVTPKLEKLLAVYARFAEATRDADDGTVQDLHRVAAGAAAFVADARLRVPKPTNSQIASGLEQGLRELSDLGGVGRRARPIIRRAMFQAISLEYPEFFSRDAERLSKVRERGRIRTEAEFYLVRHRIDVVEGHPEHEAELSNLYELVGDFEARV